VPEQVESEATLDDEPEGGGEGRNLDADAEHEEWAVPVVRRWWAWTALALSLAGFGDAFYLTIDHFNGALPICSATGVINCAKVTTSPQSYFLHVPVALLGLVFYGAMVVINLPPLWRSVHRWMHWLRLAMVATGLCMVVYLVSAEVFTIKAICLWCTGVHIVTVALFVLVVATLPTVLAAAGAGEGFDAGEPAGIADA